MEEVEQLIRKLVIFQKVLALQDKKVMGLNMVTGGGVFKRDSVAGCMLRNRADVSVKLRIESCIWLRKRPRLGWFTLQGPGALLILRSLIGGRAVLAMASAKLRERQWPGC